MPDYRIKITETEDEELTHHHYLITAKDADDAKRIAMKYMKHFIDDDEHPEIIEGGYSFYNGAYLVKLTDIKPTTKEQFKDFLLKIHTINLT